MHINDIRFVCWFYKPSRARFIRSVELIFAVCVLYCFWRCEPAQFEADRICRPASTRQLCQLQFRVVLLEMWIQRQQSSYQWLMRPSLSIALDSHDFEIVRNGSQAEYGRCRKCGRRFVLDHAGQITAVDEDGNPLGEPVNTRWVYDPCPGFKG